jgi:hypothetical protein
LVTLFGGPMTTEHNRPMQTVSNMETSERLVRWLHLQIQPTLKTSSQHNEDTSY